MSNLQNMTWEDLQEYTKRLESFLIDDVGPEKYQECADCDQVNPIDCMYDVNGCGEYVCESCLDKNYNKCSGTCGMYIADSDGHTCQCGSETEVFCDTCWEQEGCETCKKENAEWDNADRLYDEKQETSLLDIARMGEDDI